MNHTKQQLLAAPLTVLIYSIQQFIFNDKPHFIDGMILYCVRRGYRY